MKSAVFATLMFFLIAPLGWAQAENISTPQQADTSTVQVVLHTRLSAEQRAALEESLAWQLRSLDLSPRFSKVAWQRPMRDADALATLWIQVVDQDWYLYIFDARHSYVRRLEGANRDAAAVEAAVVIAQRSLTAIAEGRAPQLEQLREDEPVRPSEQSSPRRAPMPPEARPAPRFAVNGGYRFGNFAPEVELVSAPTVGIQTRLMGGFGMRAGYAHYPSAEVFTDAGNLKLQRRGLSLEAGYWYETHGFAAAGFVGGGLELWSRTARGAGPDVAVTADTEHLVWGPSLGLVVAWVPHRNIAPYLSGGSSLPLGQPTFSSDSGEGATLLSPSRVRLFAGAGVSIRVP